jgi:MATE family multidrug resistance protein
MLLMRSFSVMSMIFVGQFCSPTDFAAVSIASALANVTGNSVMVGLSSGLATLASQAYGAGDLRTMNRVFFKALALLLGVCVPISILWQWTTAFFVACGQDATVSAEAGRYMRALVPR